MPTVKNLANNIWMILPEFWVSGLLFFRKIAFLLFFVLIISSVNAQPVVAGPSATMDPLYEQGMKLYVKRDFAGAAAYLDQFCIQHPSQGEARYYLFYCLTSQKKFEEALKQIEILIRQFPENQQYKALKVEAERILSLTKTIPGKKPEKIIPSDPIESAIAQFLNGDWKERSDAMAVLGKSAAKAVDPLFSALFGFPEKSENRRKLENILAGLNGDGVSDNILSYSNGKEASKRIVAINILCRRHDEKLNEILLKLSGDPQIEVAKVAKKALEELNKPVSSISGDDLPVASSPTEIKSRELYKQVVAKLKDKHFDEAYRLFFECAELDPIFLDGRADELIGRGLEFYEKSPKPDEFPALFYRPAYLFLAGRFDQAEKGLEIAQTKTTDKTVLEQIGSLTKMISDRKMQIQKQEKEFAKVLSKDQQISPPGKSASDSEKIPENLTKLPIGMNPYSTLLMRLPPAPPNFAPPDATLHVKMLENLKSGDAMEMRVAASALGNVGYTTPEIVKSLIDTFQGNDKILQMRALESLGKHRENASDAVPEILKLVEEKKGLVRMAALNSLGEIQAFPEQVLPVLIKYSSDSDDTAAGASFKAILGFGKKSISFLEALLKDGTDKQKEIAKKALEIIRADAQ
ncbi:MAG: HEAT repeat domain-containing protein [Candidatus Riflebacteria bacterium]|nr:HEAT repeat domain-containing protein [Candidatus Riflebacteria bacterium]